MNDLEEIFLIPYLCTKTDIKKDCKVQPMQTLRTCKVSKLCKNQSF